MLEVDLNALDTALAAGEPLIDVREADEFAQVRVPGGDAHSAQRIRLSRG